MARPTAALLACLFALVLAGPAGAAEPWPTLVPDADEEMPQGGLFAPSLFDGSSPAVFPSYFKVATSPALAPDGTLADDNVVEVFPWFPTPYEYGKAIGLWTWIPGTYYWQAIGGTAEAPLIGSVRRIKVVFTNLDIEDVADEHEREVIKGSGHAHHIHVTEEGEWHRLKWVTKYVWVAEPYAYKGKVLTELRIVGGQRQFRSYFVGERATGKCLGKKRPSKCLKPVHGFEVAGPAPAKIRPGTPVRPIHYSP